MKASKLVLLAFTLSILSGSGTLFAQSAYAPAKQFGVGVFAGGGSPGGIDVNGATFSLGGGISGQYAITPGIHVGVQASLLGSSDSSSNTATISSEAIYIRGLIEAVVNPFFQASFRLNQISISTKVGNQTLSTSDSRNEIAVDFGLEGFISRNFGVYAAVNILDLRLSPSETLYGISTGTIGVEWWFNP